jgi:dihydropteroate synthase
MKIFSGWPGLAAIKRTRIMGIINTTPDSFSDGGRFLSAEAVVARAGEMIEAGVDIIDIGGESTRPFAEPVTPEEELQRVIPAIRAIRRHFQVPISIDTTKAVVARAALEEGADLINDVSSFRFDPQMITFARESGAPVIIMHMKGTPRNMQVLPAYRDVIAEITSFLRERIAWAEASGVSRERLIIDPGIGFGKTVDHNLTILKHLPELQNLGCPIMVGHSRKAFIGKTLGIEAADKRDEASAVLSALCAAKGAAILRVHDVRRTAQAVRLHEAIAAAP